MASPAAVLSILVKTQGAQAAAAQLGGIDKSGRAAAGGLSRAEGQAKRSSKTFSAMGTAAKSAGVLIGAAGLAKGISSAVTEYREAQKVGSQTTAVLKSTGSAANVTAKHIQNLAGSISKKSGIDDEAIQSSENMLLTFTKVRNETGKGNKIFDQATQTVTDMSVALGQSGKSSAIQLGKALNDPVKGITALRRVGVSFTADQQKQITTLENTGHHLQAQKIILKELRTEFAGSAAAQATAGEKFKVSLGNLAEAAGAVLVPAMDKVLPVLTKFFDQMVTGTGVGGALISKFKEFGGALAPLGQSIATIVSWLIKHQGVTRALAIGIGVLTAAIVLLNLAVSANPFVLAAVAIAALVVGVVTAYREFATFRNIINAVAGAVKSVLPTISAGISAVVAVVRSALPTLAVIAKTALSAYVAVFKAIWPVIKTYFSGGFTAIKGIITGAAQILSGAVQVIKGILHGDFREIWDGIKKIFSGGFTALKGIITGAVQGIGGAAKMIGTAIIDAIIAAIKAGASKFVDAIKGVVSGAKSAVSGALGAINPFGDGLGFKPITTIPGSAGSLMGASSSLAPFAALGAQYGLHVSDGKRPAGTRTASGGVSYHSSGQAIDLADGKGPDAAKLAAFRALKSRYGSRLAELIYTPGGAGIKDGKPFRYTGAVAADHFDHVHVAFTGGSTALGQAGNRGDGHGRGRFAGDGIGVAIGAARRAGFTGEALVRMVAIAGRESNYNPRAQNLVPPDHSIGLWQINQLAHHGRFGSDAELMNPDTNARAAWVLSGHGHNFSPWSTNRGLSQGLIDRARQAVAAFKGGGGTSGGGAGGGAASGAASTAQKVNPLDQKLASADLAIEQAKRGTIKIGGVGGRKISSAMQQVGALTSKRKLIGARIRSIRKALKGKVSPAKRLALTQELTQRLQEHAQLGTDIQALRTPAAAGGDGGSIGDVGGGAAGDTGDPNQALIDSNDALAAVVEADRQAQADHAAALREVGAEIKRQTDLATSATATSNAQAWKALADILSGQIVGRGVVGRSFTPGSGVEVRY